MTEERTELAALIHSFRVCLEALQKCGYRAAPVGSLAASAVTDENESISGVTSADRLVQLRADIGDCQRCSLASTRKTIVFGTGSANARLLFVGEAPGAAEDQEGVPFVGPAGQLLDKMIAAMGWRRESVYIANVLKCRPPENRDPRVDEVKMCQGFLAKQIEVIGPAVIVTLGKPAAHLLLQTKAAMGALRGRWQSYQGIPVLPTFHPAYLLRDPSKKRDVWADLQLVMRFLQEQGIAPQAR